MKKTIIKNKKVLLEDLPLPEVPEGFLLVKTLYSAISSGTETSLLKEEKKNLITRAKENPDLALKIIKKAIKEGIKKTYNTVKEKLDTGIQPGYSISGIIIKKGKNTEEFLENDIIAGAGAQFAKHSEYVLIPKNLAVKIDLNDLNNSNMNDKEVEKIIKYSSTIAIGSIALQGVRRAKLQIGEIVAVYGTGLIGLITIQILKAQGNKIIALDIDNQRLELAKKLGADLTFNLKEKDKKEITEKIKQYTEDHGVDKTIFTASTKSNEPLKHSFEITRKKGQVILVGVADINIERNLLYEGEKDLLISTSYGPGRYDYSYEVEGKDYPYEYVRWTEKRNMKAYLDLIKQKKVSFDLLLKKTFPLEKIEEAYNYLLSEEKPIITIIEYDKKTILKEKIEEEQTKIINKTKKVEKEKINIGIIGLGGFVKNMHLPILEELKDKYSIYAIASSKGDVDLKYYGEKYKVKYITTNYDKIIEDKNIDLVFITTQHKNHGELVLKALKNNKNVFVEKPLTINKKELEEIENFYKIKEKIEDESTNNKINNKPVLLVGFNRRFSPYSKRIKEELKEKINPFILNYRVNAGRIKDHWMHKQGGRLIGEACHMIDLARFFSNSKIKEATITYLDTKNEYYTKKENFNITIQYESGDIANIQYFATGAKILEKERIEIHFDNKSIILEDFKKLKIYNEKIKTIEEGLKKGHKEELEQLYESLKKGKQPIPLEEIFETTKLTLELDEQM